MRLNEAMERRVREYRQEIENALDRYTAGLPAYGDLAEAMRYSLLGGGKRIRGILLLEFAAMFGLDRDGAMPFACALEMIHAYSLIHDDLPCMDDDDLRRGRPSCHKQFGEATALLAGDGLLTLAFQTAAMGKQPAGNTVSAIKILGEAAGAAGMVGGQILDLRGCRTAEGLQEMVLLKTGALIRAACTMGCAAAGAGKEDLEKSGAYGGKIGLAFQIIDDILDCTSSQEVLGKPVGSDARQEKVTFAALLGLEEARRRAGSLTQEALGLLDSLPIRDQFLKDFTGMLLAREY